MHQIQARLEGIANIWVTQCLQHAIIVGRALRPVNLTGELDDVACEVDMSCGHAVKATEKLKGKGKCSRLNH